MTARKSNWSWKNGPFLLGSLTNYCYSHKCLIASEGLARVPPVTLFPSPFPRTAWEKAVRLQTTYNLLYSKVANDQFLAPILEELAEVDDFVARLWGIHKDCKKEGIAQEISLGLFRSDYMVEAESGEIKQVEFNTMSVGGAGLATGIARPHQHLNIVGAYENTIPMDALPYNPGIEKAADGLAAAHHAYGVLGAVVLFVVHDPEPNIFDQLWLSDYLFDVHSIETVRLTFSQILEMAELDSARRLVLNGKEVSVVYFRTGKMLERSRAIKCPTVITQLVGSKKVQQVLTEQGVVERYLPEEKAKEVRSTFTEIYPLDTSPRGLEARCLAVDQPENYVLKPQREGGGHNIFRQSIPGFLRSLPSSDHNAYILMKLIVSPTCSNWVVRNGECQEMTLSTEYSVFVAILWRKGDVLMNERGGWLLRSKAVDVDEANCVVGTGTLGSIRLVT